MSDTNKLKDPVKHVDTKHTETSDPELDWIVMRKDMVADDVKPSTYKNKLNVLKDNWMIPAGLVGICLSFGYGIHNFHDNNKTYRGMKMRIGFQVATVFIGGYALMKMMLEKSKYHRKIFQDKFM